MEPNQTPSSSGKKLGIGIAVVALLAVIAVVFGTKKSADTTSTDTSTVSTDTTSDTSANGGQTTTSTTSAPHETTNPNASEYKDGTYTATGSYQSPGGPDKIEVTLTLKNDVVTKASVKTEPGDRESAYYQNIFANNYTPLVVGKDISSIKLSKVSGSSLTSGGFNDAVAQIEAQAKA
ncbi:MAG TPA: calcium-binding protein [Candidatus Paceibacterota bacterium]|jgi:uncharacterized protein with FMN-binding domain|nr:calcium-binding protein [Candidatus Paceibacterota bacterium]